MIKIKAYYKENLKYLIGFSLGVVVCFLGSRLSSPSRFLTTNQGQSLSQIENKIRPKVNSLATKYDVEMFLVRKNGYVLLRILDKDIFPINSAKLSEKGEFFMNDLSVLLTEHSGDFEISGHYDSINPFGGGDKVSNQMLISTKRSSQVAAHLSKAGISSDRLDVKGFGNTVPLFDDRDKEGRYLAQEGGMNRRLEISLKVEGKTL